MSLAEMRTVIHRRLSPGKLSSKVYLFYLTRIYLLYSDIQLITQIKSLATFLKELFINEPS